MLLNPTEESLTAHPGNKNFGLMLPAIKQLRVLIFIAEYSDLHTLKVSVVNSSRQVRTSETFHITSIVLSSHV